MKYDDSLLTKRKVKYGILWKRRVHNLTFKKEKNVQK